MEEDKQTLYKCFAHKRSNEIYCTECNTYLCPECISFHNTPMHKPRYLHVLQYSEYYILPKIDTLGRSMEAFGVNEEAEVSKFLLELKKAVSSSGFDVRVPMQKLARLKSILFNLKSYLTQLQGETSQENIINELNREKKRMEILMKNKNTVELLKLVHKTEELIKLNKERERAKDLVQKLKKAIIPMNDLSIYKEAIVVASMLNTKCQMYRQEQSITEWKCDKTYLSNKMSLSEDGLTFGNTTSNGYPAIIGNAPFDSGMYAFEVIPTGLDCSGKEGFGIIEKDKYLKAYNNDKVTPTVYNDMIGFFYKSDVRGMTVKMKSDMQMGQKYIVRVNMPELWVSIKGPGVDLKGKLMAEAVYYPCFSCGCSGNKMQIKPLAYTDE